MSRTRIAAASTLNSTFRNCRGTVVGRLSNDGFLEKRGLRFDDHHLHRFGAWATEAEHIESLRTAQGAGVRLYLSDGRILESSLKDWTEHAYAPAALESRQLALPDKYWRVRPAGGRQLALIVA